MSNETATATDQDKNKGTEEPKSERKPRLTDLLKRELRDLEPGTRVFIKFDRESGYGTIETRTKKFVAGKGGALVEQKGERIDEVVSLTSSLGEFAPTEWEIAEESLPLFQAAISNPPNDNAVPELSVRQLKKLDAVRAFGLQVDWTWTTAAPGRTKADARKEIKTHRRPNLVMVRLEMIKDESDEIASNEAKSQPEQQAA